MFYDYFLHPGNQEYWIPGVIRNGFFAVLLSAAFRGLTEKSSSYWNRHYWSEHLNTDSHKRQWAIYEAEEKGNVKKENNESSVIMSLAAMTSALVNVTCADRIKIEDIHEAKES